MPFPGEQRYREVLTRAEGHEGEAAMVKVSDLKAALNEIESLRAALVGIDRDDLLYLQKLWREQAWNKSDQDKRIDQWLAAQIAAATTG